VTELQRWTGLSRSTINRHIRSGVLASRRVCGRRLIVVASVVALLSSDDADQVAAAAEVGRRT
jgi:hypothetical protein